MPEERSASRQTRSSLPLEEFCLGASPRNAANSQGPENAPTSWTFAAAAEAIRRGNARCWWVVEESRGLPLALRNLVNEVLFGAAAKLCHVGLRPGLVEEDKRLESIRA
jgi:hypothetical protein